MKVKIDVETEKPTKLSPYLEAGAPKQCFLPGCRKPFEQTCFRGMDNHYYCSAQCGEVGLNAELLKIELLRKKRA
jgi:hypothetical protein